MNLRISFYISVLRLTEMFCYLASWLDSYSTDKTRARDVWLRLLETPNS